MYRTKDIIWNRVDRSTYYAVYRAIYDTIIMKEVKDSMIFLPGITRSNSSVYSALLKDVKEVNDGI